MLEMFLFSLLMFLLFHKHYHIYLLFSTMISLFPHNSIQSSLGCLCDNMENFV